MGATGLRHAGQSDSLASYEPSTPRMFYSLMGQAGPETARPRPPGYSRGASRLFKTVLSN